MNEQETTKEEGLDLSPEEIKRIFDEDDRYYIQVGIDYYGMEY